MPFERAEDAKAFIEEGYRTGQRGENFTIGPMKLIQDGSLGARTAAMNEPYEDAPGNTGIITFSQDELDDLFAFLTGIRCRRQYTVSVTGPWIWSLRLLRSLPSGKTTKGQTWYRSLPDHQPTYSGENEGAGSSGLYSAGVY